jgi:PAS domain S-box-containing protein
MARILIADDEWLTRVGIEEMLTGLGHEVVGQAESGREAVDMARDLKPDLILMDVVMPGEINGIQAGREIKATMGIPIIFISGYSDPEYIEAAKQVEPLAYIMKPFDEKELRAFVDIGLYKREMELEVKRAYERLQQTSQELKREAQERTKTEEALRESHARYKQLFDHAPVGIYEVDLRENRLVSVNDTICKYTGYTKEELLAMDPLDLLTEESKRAFKERLATLSLGEAIPQNAEFEIFAKDGRRLWGHLHSKFFFEDGKPKAASVIAHDISERRQAEEAQKEILDRFLLLLDGLDAAVYVADMDTHEILYMNRYLRDLFGDRVGDICWKAFQAGQTGPCEFCTNDRLIAPSGEPTGPVVWDHYNAKTGGWWEVRDQAIKWPDGAAGNCPRHFETKTDRGESQNFTGAPEADHRFPPRRDLCDRHRGKGGCLESCH